MTFLKSLHRGRFLLLVVRNMPNKYLELDDMQMHDLIKAAILGKELRDKFVKKPLQTRKGCGIFTQGLTLSLSNATVFLAHLQEIKMDINKVVKLAIQSTELRKSFFVQPVETCRKLGVKTGLPCDINGIQLTMDSSLIQGGYRP